MSDSDSLSKETMGSEGLVQANAGAPALSEKFNGTDAKRPYVYTMHDIRSRLNAIRKTVEVVIKATDLQDYDDEMANDLRLAVKFLEQLRAGDQVTISNEAESDGVSLNQPTSTSSRGEDRSHEGK